ncbi:MAG: pyridoxamine 5'-phosphate oxidase family protein [Lachnospiraceae bacterium]
MRRNDRAVIDMESICDILDQCHVFRIAVSVDNEPYIVPLNFGYLYTEHGLELYFHCAKEGKKLDMIRQNPNVCFEMDCNHKLVPADIACGYGFYFQSIVGMGQVELIEENESKKNLLHILMKHQTGKNFIFTDQQVAHVMVCKIKVMSVSAKQRMPE